MLLERNMKTLFPVLPLAALLLTPALARAETTLSVNFFRNPSIGLELRRDLASLHAGFYPTIIDRDAGGANRTTWFFKSGVTLFPLDLDLGSGRSSSPYLSVSYVRGLSEGWHTHGAIGEIGFQWAAHRYVDVRLGVALLVTTDERVRVNPTPGISLVLPLGGTDAR
jgi:hypothetical protein